MTDTQNTRREEGKPTADDIVIFFNETYYMVKSENGTLVWADVLAGPERQFAKALIDSGGMLGNVKEDEQGPLAGGYSVVVDMGAVLKASKDTRTALRVRMARAEAKTK